MTQPEVVWYGASGSAYGYWISPISASFKDEPGNYIFARRVQGSFEAIYVGHAESLRDRLTNHEKEACARRYGASEIHTHINPSGERARLAEEADLIKKHQPPCNVIGR